MSLKVEIEILKEDSLGKDSDIRNTRNATQQIISRLDELHAFIDDTIADHSEDEVRVYRKALENRINAINTLIDRVIGSTRDFKYLNLSDYWPENIEDVSGLTTPAENPLELEPQKQSIRSVISSRTSKRESS